MTDNVTRRADCRLCGSTDLEMVVALTPTPPANAFVPADALAVEQPRFPLDLFFCRACGHLQLRDVVDPSVLFRDYVYVSGTSPVFVRHFEDYARTVVDGFEIPADSLVVDIGSNDGTLLGFFRDAGCRVLGIDPARDIARRATEAGIETWADFFTPALAATIRDERGPARVVTANNVFAHADDLAGIADGIAALLADDGVFVFEVSYLLDVVENTLFDTIYHEHLAYHAVAPLVPFFERHGLTLLRTERVASHGGSLRGYVGRRGGPRAPDETVAAMIARERAAGLDKAETFRAFASKINALGDELRTLLQGIKGDGRTIAGFGAPAKATTLMYHFGIGPEVIDFIVDDSPLKQGLYSPGMHIPVVPSQALYDRRPDYVVVLAWNFAAPIMENHRAFRDQGGRFIIPLPKVEIV